MEIYDFDNCPHGGYKYGGKSCRKEMLIFDDATWMIKYRGKNSRIKKIRHDQNLPDYTNSVVSEWLGSHIYEKLGFDVQETVLGVLDGKPVVACRYIYEQDEDLQELRDQLESLDDEMYEYFSSGGTITDINKLTAILKNKPLFSEIYLNEHFWDLFVADAFIGNTDRNLGNIGIVFRRKDRISKISPVYDNGSSFNCRMAKEAMQRILKNWKAEHKSVFLNSDCPYEDNGKPIFPLTYIYRTPSDDCIAAIGRIVPRIDLAKCIQPVLELKNAGIISNIQSTFYIASMSVRYRKRLLPAYEKHFGPLYKEKDSFVELPHP